MRVVAGLGFAALLSGLAFGQTSETGPKFTIADVHVSKRTTNPQVYMTGGVLRAGRYDIRNATMVDLISTAWGIDSGKVVGGPSWLELNRYDVVAKAPPATSPDDIKLMLQALVSERFKLVVHKDTKPMAGFVLSLGKGKPRLKEADGSGTPGCQGVPQQNPDPGAVPYNVVQCRSISMETFAQTVHDMANGYLNNPVVDSTGLKGNWDFDLKWTSRGLLARAGADAITIYDAVDKQLGLKLEPQKIPLQVIVVDSVNEKPSDNPPEVITSLAPPPPAEFEVADIKPSMPNAPVNGRILPGGRLDLQGFTLKLLIQVAWDISGDDMVVGAPKFLDTNKFDVIAKASSATNGPANAPQIDIDDLRLMLRALLVERFKLVTHNEDRPLNAYTLALGSGKPKLTKADPSNRTSCKEGPASAAKDPRDASPILSRLLTCQNMTMTQFADQLPTLANGYVHSAVLDETGLKDAYDFTLSFSAAGLLQSPAGGGGRGGDSPASGTASDPNGAVSLPDAVSKQLGLKLELRKRPVPVLVIDHVEEKPVEN
jgi:uncharacterized protein (TIGR03435 family)